MPRPAPPAKVEPARSRRASQLGGNPPRQVSRHSHRRRPRSCSSIGRHVQGYAEGGAGSRRSSVFYILQMLRRNTGNISHAAPQRPDIDRKYFRKLMERSTTSKRPASMTMPMPKVSPTISRRSGRVKKTYDVDLRPDARTSIADGKPRIVGERHLIVPPGETRRVAPRSLRQDADPAAVADEDPAVIIETQLSPRRRVATPPKPATIVVAGESFRDPARGEARARVPAHVRRRPRRSPPPDHRQARRPAGPCIGEVLLQHARARAVRAVPDRARAPALSPARPRDLRLRRDRARQGGRRLRQAGDQRTRARRRSSTSPS